MDPGDHSLGSRPDLEERIVSDLAGFRDRDDIIKYICEATGMRWNEATLYVKAVEEQHRPRLAVRRKGLLLFVGLAFAVGGLAIAVRGNVVDMAVGIILGAAFGTIVNSLVSDVLLPPIGLLLGRVDFANLYVLLSEGVTTGPYGSLADAQAAGAVSINYGVFINAVISFLIVAFAVFLLIRSINKLQSEQPSPAADPTSKECPFCSMQISVKARRCPYCTSQLEGAAATP